MIPPREPQEKPMYSKVELMRRYWPWVRFRRPMYGPPDRRWVWTPITYRFGHGGWIYLSLPWLWRFRNGA